jgi:hypothetical protein
VIGTAVNGMSSSERIYENRWSGGPGQSRTADQRFRKNKHKIQPERTQQLRLCERGAKWAEWLPCETVRSAPAIVVSGPAQRSLTLWPARSRSRLATLSIESSGSFVASAVVSIATGWNEPVPGRELHPLKSSASHGALFHQPSEIAFAKLLARHAF